MIVILGAGGHARVILDILYSNEKYKTKRIEILDDSLPIGTKIGKYKVSGPLSHCLDYQSECDFIVALGDNQTRKKIVQMYQLNYAVLIHSSAIIGSDVAIEEGTVIMPGAVINSGSHIGKHCIINTGATVDHDCFIHDFAHISPGVHLGGTVEVGLGSWIGIGACVRNNLSISENCVIGAGAAVVSSIKENGIYAGVPAHRVK